LRASASRACCAAVVSGQVKIGVAGGADSSRALGTVCSRTLHRAGAIDWHVTDLTLSAGTGICAGTVQAAGVLAEEAALSDSEGSWAVRRSAGGTGSVVVAGGAGRQAGDALAFNFSDTHYPIVPAMALATDPVGGAS
jgi:hypothetical protein